MSTQKKRRRNPSKVKDRPRVNLRESRENKRLSIQDIQVRTGIPLEHIEALETGIVPNSLKGRKLLRSKHRYLEFLGHPTTARLEVRKRRRKVQTIHEPTSITGSTEIEIPSTSRSIFTGFALAIGLVLGLKGLSFAMDNSSITIDGLIEDALGLTTSNSTMANTRSVEINHASKQEVSLASAAAISTTINSTEEQADDINAFVDQLLTLTVSDDEETEAQEEPIGPFGPNSLVITVLETTNIHLVCDGYKIAKKQFKSGQKTACNYTHEATLHASDISNVKIKHNERRVRPMGPQGSERRLSFVQNP